MSQLYPQGAAHILGKATKVDLVADTIKFLFYASTFNGAHEFVSDLTGASIVARSAALTSKTTLGPGGTTPGTFDAADATVLAVSGSTFARIILYKDSGADATSPLIASFDITSFAPNGGDVSVVWNVLGLFAIA